jgi:hypothetical protein
MSEPQEQALDKLLERIKAEAEWGWEKSMSHSKNCNARKALGIILSLLRPNPSQVLDGKENR